MRTLYAVAVAAALVGGCKKNEGKKVVSAPSDASAASQPSTPQEAPIAEEERAPTGRPASITDAHVATAGKVIAAVVEISQAASAAGSNCDKMAADVSALMTTHLPVIDEGRKIEKQLSGDPKAVAWMKQEMEGKMLSALEDLVRAAERCETHAGLQRAMSPLMSAGP